MPLMHSNAIARLNNDNPMPDAHRGLYQDDCSLACLQSHCSLNERLPLVFVLAIYLGTGLEDSIKQSHLDHYVEERVSTISVSTISLRRFQNGRWGLNNNVSLAGTLS